MKYHQVVCKIKNLLKKNNCWFETFEHQPVRTSEEAAKIRPGFSLDQGAKAIIMRVKKSDKDKKFLMLVFPANLKFDNEKVRRFFQAKDVRFATKEEVLSLTSGVQLGGVPPFGNLFDLEVFVDPKLFINEKIVFNAGDRRFSLALKSDDYKKIVKPQIVDIT